MRRGLAAVMLFMAVYGMAGCMEQTSGEARTGSRPLSPAPDFTLENIAGEDVNLGMLLKEKKLVLINFWATWCDPCKEEVPDLIKLQDDLKARGFTVLGVSSGESRARVAAFVERTGINYPVLLDTDQDVTRLYKVVGVPTSYLYDSEGRLLGTYNIYTDVIRRDIERALAK